MKSNLAEKQSVIYLFPGLGANEKLFKAFDFSPFKTKVISFLIPEKKETLQHYCERLSAFIDASDENIYIGVSFGGILAQEISKIIPAKKIIIISSIKSEKEKPTWFSWLKLIPLYSVIPPKALKKILVCFSEVITRKTKEEKNRFRLLVAEADDRVIRWGVKQVINWKQAVPPCGIIHIHGDKDILFPVKKIKADFVIHGGAHFMIMREEKEINELINSLLKLQHTEAS